VPPRKGLPGANSDGAPGMATLSCDQIWRDSKGTLRMVSWGTSPPDQAA
jgi:hypothetical protein